ncbi:hypothetical protein N9235_03255 [Gammaproteobacteria bacterium]|nr:hypothetical protein [Gammaproteobacteria bacterium]
MNGIMEGNTTTAGTAKIIYILYLVGIVFGLTAIVGVIMAYVNKTDAPEWLATHYQFQIRTFWIGLLYLVIGAALAAVFIGYLIILFWVVWLIIRCIKGIKFLDMQKSYPDPAGWMF